MIVVDSLPPAERAALGVFTGSRVNKDLMISEVAELLGVSEGSARARLSRLYDRGLVDRTRTAGFTFYRRVGRRR